MKRLTQQNGFLLVATFAALILLTILSAAIFSKSVHETIVMRYNLDKLSAKYNAEMGYECAYYEILQHGQIWQTHNVITGQVPPVLHYDETADPLDVTLSTIAEHRPSSPHGAYEALNGTFSVKVYEDPIDEQLIILSRGISNNGDHTYLLASKVAAISLYEYFWFTPYRIHAGWTTYDANGGRMHTNDVFTIWDSVDIIDIRELSSAKHIMYGNEPFLPPAGSPRYDADGNDISATTPPWEDLLFWYRPDWRTELPITEPEYRHYNWVDGFTAGGERGLFMLNDGSPVHPDYPVFNPSNPRAATTNQEYVPCMGSFSNCYIPQENALLAPGNTPFPELYTIEDYYIYADGSKPLTELHTDINTDGGPIIQIPNMLDDPWDYNVYHQSWNGRPCGATKCHWPRLQDGKITTLSKSLHSVEQTDAWTTWLDENNLTGIIKDSLTEAHHISPLKINAQTYGNQAKDDGMYIAEAGPLECTGAGEPMLEINPTGGGSKIEICPDGNGDYTYKGVTIATTESFVDVNSWLKKDEVITLDLGKLGSGGVNIWPDNGIIYSEFDVGLDNAEDLSGPLTTVGERNCYLFGNYNTGAKWQPSAVISAQTTHTLSSTFLSEMQRLETDAPDGLPNLLHNPNLPYVVDDYSPSLDCDETQGGPGCIGSREPTADYWDGDGDFATSWQDEMAGTMTPGVTADHAYYVSIIGYSAYPPTVLEDWCPPSTGCKQKLTVGAFVTLPDDNFKWAGWPNDKWPAIDKDHVRSCAPGGPDAFATKYPTHAGVAKLCRGDGLLGWPHDMASEDPWNNRNIYEYEDNYDTSDPSTLPPGELPGFFDSILLAVPDSDYYFNHHNEALTPQPVS
ncbi:hypothetical protein ACFL1E_01135 [Candidatus Omnitrophota bacterium]